MDPSLHNRLHRTFQDQIIQDDTQSVQAAQSLVELPQKGGQTLPYSPGSLEPGMMDEELEELGYMHKDETKLFIRLMSGEHGFETQLQRTRDMNKKNMIFEELSVELAVKGFPKRSVKRLKDKWRDLCSRFRELKRNSSIEEPRWEYFDDMRSAVGFMPKFNSVKSQGEDDDDIDHGDFDMDPSNQQAQVAAAMLSAAVAAQQSGSSSSSMMPSPGQMMAQASSMRKRKRGSMDGNSMPVMGGGVGVVMNGIALTAGDIQNIIRQNGEMMDAARRDRELLLKFVAEDRIAAERRHRDVMNALERLYAILTNGEMLHGSSMGQGQVHFAMGGMGGVMLGQQR